MTFDLNDLKTAIIGFVVGIITFFVCLAIQRWRSNRNIKSWRRKIDETEAYKARLDNLARSDRALLIMGFEAVFAIVIVICCSILMYFSLLDKPTQLIPTLVFALLLALPIILCFGLIKTLEDIRNHPQALERLERKLTSLRNKLLERKDR